MVHACECIAVPRKPRVKKQKLDMEPPPVVPDKLSIITSYSFYVLKKDFVHGFSFTLVQIFQPLIQVSTSPSFLFIVN